MVVMGGVVSDGRVELTVVVVNVGWWMVVEMAVTDSNSGS